MYYSYLSCYSCLRSITVTEALGASAIIATCATQRETGSAPLLLHGASSRCYQAGSQGPCEPNHIIAQSQISSHLGLQYGICKPVDSTPMKLEELFKLQQVLQRIREESSRQGQESLERLLRKQRTLKQQMQQDEKRLQPLNGEAMMKITHGIHTITCPSGQYYSSVLKKCFQTRRWVF
ncbi:hypothetical protein Ocin01_15078 [Orchesella cincta]|uniref:Uncharacterized protein n=1 Tax=Orchesella cincta TaxID=48709 RepID=A0A1D2MFD7_ORCCI|nr:hypothetical protein Ocin01_15078 [Orchesella cincta]